MEKTTSNAIAQALRVNLYREPQRRNGRLSAQDQLNDRTHYVSDSSLRYHHARVLGCAPMFDGLFFRITESVSLDPQNTQRGTRCVLFDLTGRTVFHPSLDDTRRSSDAAIRQFWQWANTFAPVAHYRAKLTDNAARLALQAEEMQALAQSLEG